MGRKVSVALVGHWAAECPKRCKNGQGGEGESGKGQGKKGKSVKGKTDDGKGQGKGGMWQARKALEGYYNHCWKWGHMAKDCFTLAKTKAKGGKGKSAGSPDESEASGPENTSVDGFGLCSFGNQCGDVCARLETNVVTGSDVHSGQWRGSVCST